jgi:hypothetical protein
MRREFRSDAETNPTLLGEPQRLTLKRHASATVLAFAQKIIAGAPAGATTAIGSGLPYTGRQRPRNRHGPGSDKEQARNLIGIDRLYDVVLKAGIMTALSVTLLTITRHCHQFAAL